MPIQLPELLAPAGNMDSLRAALAAGADAVYLGLGDFNARRNADNLSLEDLEQACLLAHMAGRRIYLTMNIGMRPQEVEQALSLAGEAWHRGADALIVQDLGLFKELHRRFPSIELHASTQMNAHSTTAVRTLAAAGAKVVTLAREMSLEEVSQCVDTAAEFEAGIEVFAHGALCICYSGQCLMSSLIGGRSANRGLCAQPCRLPWTLIDTSTGKRIQTEGDHLLSPADLCTIEILPQLVSTGIASCKIEGRMKSPEYVALVTGVYRRALDLLAEKGAEGFQVDDRDWMELTEAFSRGFTQAYLVGQRGNEIMSYKRPNNRGMLVGRVTNLKGGKVQVALEEQVTGGDLLEFWTNRGHCSVSVPNTMETVEAGGTLELKVSEPVSPGDRVFRVRNAELLRKAASLYDVNDEASAFIELDAQVLLKTGQEAQVSFSLASNPDLKGSAAGQVIEAARTKTITSEEVSEHVGRLGGTPYRVRNWDIRLEGNPGCGFSLLHRLRRDALQDLEEQVLATNEQRRLPRTKREREDSAGVQRQALQVCVLVRDRAGAKAAKAAGADLVYQQVLSLEAGGDQGFFKDAIPVLSNICHDADEDLQFKQVQAGEPVLVGNLAQLVACAEKGALPEAGPQMCTLNPFTLQALTDCGASCVWLSPELSLEDITQVAAEATIPLGLFVSGRQELMVTQHCELMAKGPCSQDCGNCPRRKSPHLLEDRKGYRFPIRTDALGRGHIYNSIPLDLTPYLPELVTAGISRVMVDATLMTTKEIADEVARALRGKDIAIRCSEHLGKREGYTTGHLFRPVQ